MSSRELPAVPAAGTRLGLVAFLIALAALAWWSTVRAMAGMDTSPSAELGVLGWFVGVWVVMMAAMMLPAVSPTVALYARMTRQRGLARPDALPSLLTPAVAARREATRSVPPIRIGHESPHRHGTRVRAGAKPSSGAVLKLPRQ